MRHSTIPALALCAVALAGPMTDAHAQLRDKLKKAVGALPIRGAGTAAGAIGVAGSAADAIGTDRGPMQEYALGYHVSARVLGNYTPLPAAHPAHEYVAAVGSTLALASHLPYPYRGYSFTVLDDDGEINAFAAPGGFVYVTTGMLRFLENEDELASVLGHEIAHVELGHGVKSIDKGKWGNFVSTSAGFALDQTVGGSAGAAASNAFSAMTDAVTDKVTKGYSRDLEGEADRRGAELCMAAGYDPKVAPGILARFKSVTGSYGGATYPKEREADLHKHVGALEPAAAAAVNPARTARYKAMLESL